MYNRAESVGKPPDILFIFGILDRMLSEIKTAGNEICDFPKIGYGQCANVHRHRDISQEDKWTKFTTGCRRMEFLEILHTLIRESWLNAGKICFKKAYALDPGHVSTC